MSTSVRVLTGLLFTTTLLLVSAEDATKIAADGESIPSSQYHSPEGPLAAEKRYPKSGFIGSRGKKLRSAFLGVRGRRTDPTQTSEWSNYASQFNGDNGYWDASMDQEYIQPRNIKSDYMNDLAAAVRQREQLGSWGQYMLKRGDYSSNDDDDDDDLSPQYYEYNNLLDKRGMKNNQFLGMRGKKLRNNAFLGMRGKKSSESDESLQNLVDALESRSGSSLSKRRYPSNAFVGMRG